MRRIITVLILAVVAMALPMAQAQLRVGVKLGANVCETSASIDETKLKTTSLTNFTGGVTAEWIVIAGFGIDVSAMYTAKGSVYSFGDNFGHFFEGLVDKTLENKVHYIEVPVNLKYKLQIPAIQKVIAPYIYLGPSFAFKVGESIEVGDTNISSDKVKNNEVDYAFNLGVGFELIRHINLSVQYGWGLDSASDFKFLDKIIDDTSFKSGAWTVTLGWMF